MEENEEFASDFNNEEIPISKEFWNYMENYWHNNREFPESTETSLGKKADLIDGKVPASQLPSYVDDVLEFDTFDSLPNPGEKGKIYLITNDNSQFRWSGSEYIQLNSDEFLMNLNGNQSVTGRKSFFTSGGSAFDNNSLRVQSNDGSNPGLTFYKGGTDISVMYFDGIGNFKFRNSNDTVSRYLVAQGFKKDGFDDNSFLTAGGGSVLRSAYPTTAQADAKYVPFNGSPSNINLNAKNINNAGLVEATVFKNGISSNQVKSLQVHVNTAVTSYGIKLTTPSTSNMMGSFTVTIFGYTGLTISFRVSMYKYNNTWFGPSITWLHGDSSRVTNIEFYKEDDSNLHIKANFAGNFGSYHKSVITDVLAISGDVLHIPDTYTLSINPDNSTHTLVQTITPLGFVTDYFNKNRMQSKHVASVTSLDSALPNGGFITSLSTSAWGGTDRPTGANYGGFIRFSDGTYGNINAFDLYFNRGTGATDPKVWFRTKNASGLTNFYEFIHTGNISGVTIPQLSNYLPLTGGELTGALIIKPSNSGGVFEQDVITFHDLGGADANIIPLAFKYGTSTTPTAYIKAVGKGLNGVNGATFQFFDNTTKHTEINSIGVTSNSFISSRLGSYGTYNASQTQGIWSIGTAYNVGTSTTDLGTQYGIAYSYIGIGGSSVSSKHQIHFVNNGLANVSINLNDGVVRANQYQKVGGTATQFLKADGTVDSNSYSLTTHTHNFNDITNKPTTLLGYGITDGYKNNYIIGQSVNTGAVTTLDSYLPTGGFITGYGAPTWGGSDTPTGASYGGYIKFSNQTNNNNLDLYFNNGHNSITNNRLWFRTKNSSNGVTNWYEVATREWSNSAFSLNTHTHTFSSLTSKPTTLAGYGIIDAISVSHPVNGVNGAQINNWNSAFGWGNHAEAGYASTDFVNESIEQITTEHINPEYPVLAESKINTIIITEEFRHEYLELASELIPERSISLINLAPFDIDVRREDHSIDKVLSGETTEYYITSEKRLIKKGTYRKASFLV